MRLSEGVPSTETSDGKGERDGGPPDGEGQESASAASVRRSLGLTVASAFLPGLGHLLSGRRRIGITLLCAYVLLLVAGSAAGLGISRDRWIELGFDRQALDIATYGAATLAVIWPLIILGSYLVTRPARMSRGQNAVAGGVVLALCIVFAAPLAWAAQTAYIARHDVLGIFAGNKVKDDGTDVTAADPFANKPRLNLLILGGDAAANRPGVRTDSIMVASIDTHTGRTLLISIPRNLNKAPFPNGTPMHDAFPQGFQCQPEISCYLNAVYQYGEQHPEMIGRDTRHPGADLLAQTVGTMLGMKIDYYILAEIFGFRDIVDALDGVKIRVTERIPVGGREEGGVVLEQPTRYIEPGLKHLDGDDAMWYARSRFGSTDYERMIRQRCMIGAIVRQADPARVLLSFNRLASAAKKLVATDLPAQLMPALVKLAMHGKSAKIVGASIDHSVFGPSNNDPDYPAIRKEARRLLRAEAAIAAEPSGAAATTSPTAGAGSATDLFSTGQCSYS